MCNPTHFGCRTYSNRAGAELAASSLLAVFIVHEGAVPVATGKENSSTVFPSYEPCEQYRPSREGVSAGAIVKATGEVTNHFLFFNDLFLFLFCVSV